MLGLLRPLLRKLHLNRFLDGVDAAVFERKSRRHRCTLQVVLMPRGLLEVSTGRRPFSVEPEASSRHGCSLGLL